MTFLVKPKPFCKVFGKMTVVMTSMSHVGKKPREATIFCFTSVVQIAKWLLYGFNLETVFLGFGRTSLEAPIVQDGTVIRSRTTREVQISTERQCSMA
jgi:hypothetical protein